MTNLFAVLNMYEIDRIYFSGPMSYVASETGLCTSVLLFCLFGALAQLTAARLSSV